MNKISYKNVVDSTCVNKGKLKRLLLAFIGGGIIATIGQALYDLYFFVFNIGEKDALSLMLVTVIFVSAILTGIGVFDKIGQIFGAGTFVPISGFSNSLTSAALESKAEGLIYGIGSNMFKLAGAIIATGIISAFIIGTIIYLLRG